jgi:hypothetical protein
MTTDNTTLTKLADAMFADPQHPGWAALPELREKVGRLVCTRSAAEKVLLAFFDMNDVNQARDANFERCLDRLRETLVAIAKLADGELQELQQNQR